MKLTLINYQEIIDNKILYEMFKDEVYKSNFEHLQTEIYNKFNNLSKNSKYLILKNFPNDGTYYDSVIIVENDMKKTFDKIIDLLNSLGKIDFIKFEDGCIVFKLKDSYELCLFDFSEGVI